MSPVNGGHITRTHKRVPPLTPEPRKRPKSSYVRFEAALPNEMWQTDMCHWRLADGTGAEILSFIDDRSRYALSVPAAIYLRLPKAQPSPDGTPAPWRIRHDRIDTTGTVTIRHNSRLHHIGIGRRHAHTEVLMIINNLNIRIINPTTGELLRQLTLNPDRDYQPQPKT